MPAEKTPAEPAAGLSSCYRQAGRKVVEIKFRRQSRSDQSMIRQIYGERGFATDRWPQGRALEKYFRTELQVQRLLIFGASILWFNAHFPGSSIFAIEPDAANLAVLELITPHLANLHVSHGALGGAPILGRLQKMTSRLN